jgi:hypothetical protein
MAAFWAWLAANDYTKEEGIPDETLIEWWQEAEQGGNLFTVEVTL